MGSKLIVFQYSNESSYNGKYANIICKTAAELVTNVTFDFVKWSLGS